RASNLREELVRQRREDAGAVAGVRLRAARAAMIHAAEQVIRIADDLMAADAFDVRDEADAAAVVLHVRAVESVGARPSNRRARANHSAVVLFRRSHGFSLGGVRELRWCLMSVRTGSALPAGARRPASILRRLNLVIRGKEPGRLGLERIRGRPATIKNVAGSRQLQLWRDYCTSQRSPMP